MSIYIQTVPKTQSGLLKVPFLQGLYNSPPTVILTPYWKGSTGQVGHVPTINSVSNNGCEIVSGNAASNYFVNVLSVDNNVATVGGRPADSGSALKEGSTNEIIFNNTLEDPDPVILLSAYWKKQGSEVGSIETLDDSAASECKVISGNAASNFYTNYVALSLGIYTTANGQLLQSGITNKTGGGKHRVYFSQAFKTPPTVALSPWWNDANSQVGSIETLVKVTTYYFEFISNNAATNYFVNWVAIGS